MSEKKENKEQEIDENASVSAENEKNGMEPEDGSMTDLQSEAADVSDKSLDADKMSEGKDDEKMAEALGEPSWEEKFQLLSDSHLRLMAEFDNYRKRTMMEKAELIKSGGKNVLESLLPVIDDFERALKNMALSEGEASASEGVKLIYDKFLNVLAQQGVKPIDAIGKPFDTEFFDAVAKIPALDDVQKGVVVDCVQTGYLLYDKVLRFAKVVVGE